MNYGSLGIGVCSFFLGKYAGELSMTKVRCLQREPYKKNVMTYKYTCNCKDNYNKITEDMKTITQKYPGYYLDCEWNNGLCWALGMNPDKTTEINF